MVNDEWLLLWVITAIMLQLLEVSQRNRTIQGNDIPIVQTDLSNTQGEDNSEQVLPFGGDCTQPDTVCKLNLKCINGACSCSTIEMLDPTTGQCVLHEDHLCLELAGTCQEDDNKCSGSYFSGKCAGASTRRCCTPDVIENDAGYCSNIAIISRDSWGARRPKGSNAMTLPVPNFLIHHTAFDRCFTFKECANEVKDVQNFHMDDPTRRYFDIGYSFLIGEDGKVYEGRGFQRTGAHTKNYNDKSFASAFMGNFDQVLPNQESQDAVRALMQCAVNRGYMSSNYKLLAHRDVRPTLSPGTAFYQVIKTWPRYTGTS